jgi:8-oxo-dGTP diphosphatase
MGAGLHRGGGNSREFLVALPMLGAVSWSATNSEGYEAPAALATDVVVLTVRDGGLLALTVSPVGGSARALPGGFVGAGERPLDTALRKLHEKTGLQAPYIEQLGAFADPGRDPRGWIPSIAYLALVPPATEVPDASAHWIAARDPAPLAFDHGEVLAAAVERLEGKLWWSNVTVGMLPGPFSLSDARRVYEAIAQTRYDPATFGRDLKATGLIEPTGEQRAAGPGRPAAMYRFTSNRPTWGAGRRKRLAA